MQGEYNMRKGDNYMKKLLSLALAACVVFTSASAFAETSGGTHGGHKAKTHQMKTKSMKAKSHKMKTHKAHTKAGKAKIKALPKTGLGGASN